MADVDHHPCAYKGAGGASTADLISGTVHMMFANHARR